MANTAQQIIADIESHFSTLIWQKQFSDLYIGITKDINQRLFWDHWVRREWHWWIYRQAINTEHSRFVEKYFLDKWMKGGGGGWDHTAVYVYCYEVSHYTKE